MRAVVFAFIMLVVATTTTAQQVTLPDEPIVFGQPFELTVVCEPSFDDAQLLPLQVELLARTAKGASEERRYRARCYELGDVTLALEPPQPLLVASCLPEPAGELELPGDGWELPTESATSWWPFVALAGFLVGALVGLLRRKPVATTETVTPATDSWDALQALTDLQASQLAAAAFYLELKAIVRKHCAQRFHLPATVRTSEELLSALPNAKPALQPCLLTCDMVLFGGEVTAPLRNDAAKRTAAHDHAIQFVKLTKQADLVEASA